MVYLLMFTSIPFGLVAFGFLLSISRRGKEGIVWRTNIGLALDRLVAAIVGWPDKRTICGHVGKKCATSKSLIWPLYRMIIEQVLPWWYKGHCADTAKKEEAY